jgi:hypothetical protein
VPRAEGLGDEDEGQGLEQASEDEDDFEEYGAAEGGSDRSRQQLQQQRRQRQRQRQQQEQDEGPDGASHAPAKFTAAVALAQLQALRSFSSQWMTLLCRVYIDVSGFALVALDALAAAMIAAAGQLAGLVVLRLDRLFAGCASGTGVVQLGEPCTPYYMMCVVL